MMNTTRKRTLLWTLILAGLWVLPAQAQTPDEIPLGSAIPMADVALADVQGGQATLNSLTGEQGTVVVFWSNQCPWVEKYEERFTALVNDFSGRGFAFTIINSNDPAAYPKETADASARRFDSAGYPGSLTYLADAQSQLAQAFGAERTPHVFVFDANESLVYVGTIDDSPGDPDSVEAQYLRDALNAVANGSSVPVPKTKAFGCTIKFAG